MTVPTAPFLDPDFGGIAKTNRFRPSPTGMTVELAEALATADRHRIAAARTRVGLSQEALAVLLGVSARTVGGWEAGDRSPRRWRREAWAAEAARLRAVGGGRAAHTGLAGDRDA